MKKIKAILERPQPATITQRRIGLGLAGCYRRFIEKFTEKSSLPHAARAGKAPFNRSEEMNNLLEEIKVKLTLPPVLAIPNFEKPFKVETEGSLSAVAAIRAEKKEDKKYHLDQYALRTMKAAEQKYLVCEKEAVAVIFALKKFYIYLLGPTAFQLFTDHQALKYAF